MMMTVILIVVINSKTPKEPPVPPHPGAGAGGEGSVGRGSPEREYGSFPANATELRTGSIYN